MFKDSRYPSQQKPCFHFSKGTCRFGESCRYLHTTSDGELDRGDNRSAVERWGDFESEQTFSLTWFRDQLTKNMTSGSIFSGHSDGFVCFWPGRNRFAALWKGFLMPSDGDPWSLDSQTQVLNFINSGLHALSDDNMAPQFVRELGKNDGRGFILMKEMLELEYSIDAGRQRDVVSFQRGLVPFVTMLTMRRMELVSQHVEEANYVYSFVRKRHLQLFRLYKEHLTQIVERHSVEDFILSHENFLTDSEGRKYAPLSFTQICLPFIRLLYVFGNKFKDFIYQDSFRGTVTYIDKLIDKWTDDSHEGDSPLDSTLCFKVMREVIKRLQKMIQRGEHNVQLGIALTKQKKQNGALNLTTPDVWDVIELGVPEEAILNDGSIGPRHDNDRRHIQNIQLLPTTEECLSRESPVLPGNFPFHENAHWLPPGPERWLDTHFRLYREDFCSTIRACLQNLEYRFRESNENILAGRYRDADADYNVYPVREMVMPMKHTYSRAERDEDQPVYRHGLCIDVSFPHPSIHDMTGKRETVKTVDITQTRRELWEKTRRLPYRGMIALVNYVNGVMEIVFCQVIQRDLDQLVKNIAEITIQPFETSDFGTFERWQRLHIKDHTSITVLIEFNKVFFIAYEPVLRALQRISPDAMPFLDYLAPDILPQLVQMETPFYCLVPGFKFDLTSVIKKHSQEVGNAPQLHLNPNSQHSRLFCEIGLMRYSTLERDQAKALVQALSSRVACIQGLPGTGKSFIGALLTQIIVEVNITPIMIVCYTNHALDQFLCHLLDIGITSLVRIGGQCKELRLEKYNLSKIPKTFQRYELKMLYEQLDRNADAIAEARYELSRITSQPSWWTLKWFLEENYPDEYDDFEEQRVAIFEDCWDVAGCEDVLDYWIKGLDGKSIELKHRGLNMCNRANVWTWSISKRHTALSEWCLTMCSDKIKELVRAQENYKRTLKRIEIVKDQADVELLKRVQIIGMTTTGVAKNQQKIAAVAPPVVICEEAGEVLEAQLMACLSPACQHLVLIGDHKQLRPHIADYNLSVESAVGKRFALDVSLFERLVGPTSGLPFWMLTEQHRMRPQISQLIRMLFYPEVRDASETLEYPPLLGVDKNVFFVNHNHPEDGASVVLGASARSHSNEYEVAYLVATLRYLLQQGYHTNDIAILTPYVGQLMKLRSALRGQFVLELNELDLEEIQRTLDDDDDEDDDIADEIRYDSAAALGATKKELSGAIRAATIDNFQGEEATVILASLVRSSTNVHGRGTIGFLKTPNRINVLLSRAKHGLILVGHGELLRAKSPLWQQVLDQLESDGCYGDGLPLYCQHHSRDHRVVTNPESFALLAPDGGCLRPCGRRLPRCGHACPKLCHVDQPTHETIYCTQPCPRLQEGCGHVCPGVCGDACGRCETLVGSIVLPCCHTYRNARCFESKTPIHVQCKELVDKVVPECGHIQRVMCSVKKVKCTRKCGEVLSCGYDCTRSCSECIENTLTSCEKVEETYFPLIRSKHGACQTKCDRLLPCCHRCQGVCHGKTPCSPCQRICDVFSCEHGSCNHPCSDPCTSCTERCSWSCEHCGDCPLPCGAPCNRRLCDHRCTKSLTCGHQCPSVCGEDCPSQEFCHVCGNDDVKERVADVILFQTYAEVDPSEDPVFILPCCSMVYTMATLDGTLHMSSYYDTNGTPSGPLPGDYIDTPQCPNCKKPIRGLRRYGRVTKRAAIDAAEKKFITHAQRQLIILQQRVNDAVDRGDLTQDKILHQNLRCFGSMVKRPPCQKVFEACVSLLKKSQGGQGDDNNLDLSTLPVPNSTFRFVGYFNLFSAQIRLLCSRPTASKAETYARQALKQFIDGSYSQQTGEAKLVLVQVLLMQADKMLNESPKSEEERTKREEQVKPLVSEATDLLEDLESSSDWFQSQHTQDFYRLHRSLVSVARRARNSTFYQSVSTNELRAIKTAMQVKLRGSGHWYRCVNGHSYVIGDCGMAMEQTCCPECGAPVGGANHSFVEGTERDMHMDSL